MVFLFVEEEECHVANSCVEWVIDSATSYHATSNKEFFTTYKAGDFGKVNMVIVALQTLLGLVMCAFKPILVAH